MRTITTSLAALVALPLMVGTGCAPRTNRALQHAQAEYNDAATDPEVSQKAPVALHEAQQAVDAARRAWERDRDETDTNSLAYVAERRVDIARSVAQQKAAEEEAQNLSQNREQVLLQARTGEADAERQRARRLEDELRQLNARQTERGTVVTFGDVLFETDSAELKPGATRELQRLATVVRQEPDRRVVIEGHTDDTGSAEHNRSLSEERAAAVRDALVSAGVPRDRIESHGLGESYPVAPNTTAAGRQQNRRVEVIMSPTSATAGVGKEPQAQPVEPYPSGETPAR